MNLDHDSHTSGHNRTKKLSRPSMDRELHDSLGVGDDVDEEDDGVSSSAFDEDDEDSFGAASDDCEPDQNYLESVLEDYHPERVNLLDQSVPEPITTPKVEAVTQERRLSRSLHEGSIRYNIMKNMELDASSSSSSEDSDSNSKEKENKKLSPTSAAPATPARNGTATIAIDKEKENKIQSSSASAVGLAKPAATDETAINTSDSADDGDDESTSAKPEQRTEDSSEACTEGEGDDYFPAPAAVSPKRMMGERPGLQRPALEHGGSSTKKSFRSIGGKNFWSKPFRRVVKSMKRPGSSKNVDSNSNS